MERVGHSLNSAFFFIPYMPCMHACMPAANRISTTVKSWCGGVVVNGRFKGREKAWVTHSTVHFLMPCMHACMRLTESLLVW